MGTVIIDPDPGGGGSPLSVAIAVPVGIWAGRNPKVEAALGPVLDALQTIPSFVYIIPVVMLFTVGQVPGIIASVLYAIVPGIRITALGSGRCRRERSRRRRPSALLVARPCTGCASLWPPPRSWPGSTR